jgi:hygromycin-B 7''-O-kinase
MFFKVVADNLTEERLASIEHGARERHTLMDRVMLELVEEVSGCEGSSPAWRSNRPRPGARLGVASDVPGDPERARLDEVPFPRLSPSQVGALVGRYHLAVGPDEVRLLCSSGIMHSVYELGVHFVLRVPKDQPEAIADPYTGSVAAPVAHAAGGRTPAIVVFDDERDIAAVPLSLFERAAGEPLVHIGAHPQALGQLWAELGRDLATLHREVTVCDDPYGRLQTHDFLSEHGQLVDELGAAGVIGEDAATWLMAVLSRLQPAAQDRGRYRRFVHGDAQPSNALVAGGHYSAIVDWDDAGWSDPVVDLRYVPVRVADIVVEGYRSGMPMDGNATAEQRLLWDRLIGSLLRLRLRRLARPVSGVISGTQQHRSSRCSLRRQTGTYP